ncbi:MAG: AMP-binding protein, partial [Chromatiales bacterium]|nr:AMP-binding protein [Chromatiales bacterium]
MLNAKKDSWTVIHAVQTQAARYGDRVFCTFEDGTELTFADFDQCSNALASALASLSVSAGDRVMMLGQNSRSFLIAWLAVMKRGAIFVPINTELKGAFLEHQVRNSEPRVVFVDAVLRKAFDTISLEGLTIDFTVQTQPDANVEVRPLADSQLLALDTLMATSPNPADVVSAKPGDICTIMYTSGTTGPSKGVLMPHGHCFLFGRNAARSFGLGEDDVMYICMPFFHAMGLPIQLLSCLIAGTPCHVVKRFSATSWLDDVRACNATVTFGLGVIPEFLFRQPPTPHDLDNKLRIMVAVPVADEWGLDFEKRFGLRLMQGYGMTECNIPAWYSLDDPLVGGRAGPIIDDSFEVRIVDTDTDEPVEVGEVGEIVIRPKHASCFMAGYFRMPERTIDAWRNLWFHSGDAGRIDAEGRLYFVDRIKDCIRRRGENISSYEIEQVLNDHPGVAESAVVGVRVKDAGGEEEVKACVVFQDNRPSPEQLLDWCVERMPRYAVPRYIEPAEELEKTPTGKLRKQGIREAGVTPATWDRESVG